MNRALVPAAALLALALGAPGAPAAERVYKWVDEQGVTHYSQTPPAGVEATPLDVATGAPAGGSAEQALERYRKVLAPPKAAEEKASAGKVDPAKEAEARARNCKVARERLAILTARSRILVLRPDGTSERLTEEQRQAEIERMKAIIAANCED
ncbi:MAG TPA: DUF4124 domain-containing protein [Chromatiales bacterium]|nr:DUF4124 domain-containing protein [Chromatiales bacterium]